MIPYISILFICICLVISVITDIAYADIPDIPATLVPVPYSVYSIHISSRIRCPFATCRKLSFSHSSFYNEPNVDVIFTIFDPEDTNIVYTAPLSQRIISFSTHTFTYGKEFTILLMIAPDSGLSQTYSLRASLESGDLTGTELPISDSVTIENIGDKIIGKSQLLIAHDSSISSSLTTPFASAEWMSLHRDVDNPTYIAPILFLTSPQVPSYPVDTITLSLSGLSYWHLREGGNINNMTCLVNGAPTPISFPTYHPDHLMAPTRHATLILDASIQDIFYEQDTTTLRTFITIDCSIEFLIREPTFGLFKMSSTVQSKYDVCLDIRFNPPTDLLFEDAEIPISSLNIPIYRSQVTSKPSSPLPSVIFPSATSATIYSPLFCPSLVSAPIRITSSSSTIHSVRFPVSYPSFAITPVLSMKVIDSPFSNEAFSHLLLSFTPYGAAATYGTISSYTLTQEQLPIFPDAIQVKWSDIFNKLPLDENGMIAPSGLPRTGDVAQFRITLSIVTTTRSSSNPSQSQSSSSSSSSSSLYRPMTPVGGGGYRGPLHSFSPITVDDIDPLDTIGRITMGYIVHQHTPVYTIPSISWTPESVSITTQTVSSPSAAPRLLQWLGDYRLTTYNIITRDFISPPLSASYAGGSSGIRQQNTARRVPSTIPTAPPPPPIITSPQRLLLLPLPPPPLTRLANLSKYHQYIHDTHNGDDNYNDDDNHNSNDNYNGDDDSNDDHTLLSLGQRDMDLSSAIAWNLISHRHLYIQYSGSLYFPRPSRPFIYLNLSFTLGVVTPNLAASADPTLMAPCKWGFPGDVSAPIIKDLSYKVDVLNNQVKVTIELNSNIISQSGDPSTIMLSYLWIQCPGVVFDWKSGYSILRWDQTSVEAHPPQNGYFDPVFGPKSSPHEAQYDKSPSISQQPTYPRPLGLGEVLIVTVSYPNPQEQGYEILQSPLFPSASSPIDRFYSSVTFDPQLSGSEMVGLPIPAKPFPKLAYIIPCSVLGLLFLIGLVLISRRIARCIKSNKTSDIPMLPHDSDIEMEMAAIEPSTSTVSHISEQSLSNGESHDVVDPTDPALSADYSGLANLPSTLPRIEPNPLSDRRDVVEFLHHPDLPPARPFAVSPLNHTRVPIRRSPHLLSLSAYVWLSYLSHIKIKHTICQRYNHHKHAQFNCDLDRLRDLYSNPSRLGYHFDSNQDKCRIMRSIKTFKLQSFDYDAPHEDNYVIVVPAAPPRYITESIINYYRQCPPSNSSILFTNHNTDLYIMDYSPPSVGTAATTATTATTHILPTQPQRYARNSVSRSSRYSTLSRGNRRSISSNVVQMYSDDTDSESEPDFSAALNYPLVSVFDVVDDDNGHESMPDRQHRIDNHLPHDPRFVTRSGDYERSIVRGAYIDISDGPNAPDAPREEDQPGYDRHAPLDHAHFPYGVPSHAINPQHLRLNNPPADPAPLAIHPQDLHALSLFNPKEPAPVPKRQVVKSPNQRFMRAVGRR